MGVHYKVGRLFSYAGTEFRRVENWARLVEIRRRRKERAAGCGIVVQEENAEVRGEYQLIG